MFKKLVSAYEAQHPGVKISPLFVNNDDTLQKVLTAVKGGSAPDIAYLYGSWAPQVAQIPSVVNLTQVVEQSGVDWNDFYVGERDVATVNGKVIGVPALVDNLAVVYNKKLFQQAGLTPPTASWTWSDFERDAAKLTSAAKKQYGTAYVTPAARTASGTGRRCCGRRAARCSRRTTSRPRSTRPPGSSRCRPCAPWRSPTSRCTSTRPTPPTSTCSTRARSG